MSGYLHAVRRAIQTRSGGGDLVGATPANAWQAPMALPEDVPIDGGQSTMPAAGVSVDPRVTEAPQAGPMASMPGPAMSEAAPMSYATQPAPAPEAAPIAVDGPGELLPAAPQWRLARPGGVMPAREVTVSGPRQTDAENRAIQAQGEAALIRNEVEGDAQISLAAANELAAQEVRQAMADRKAAIDAQLAQYKSDLDEYKAQVRDQLSQGEIDPNRYWNSKSTFSKVASIISVFLGGFVSGIEGGRNQMLDRLDALKQQDIDSQKIAREMRFKNTQALLSGVEQNQNMLTLMANEINRAEAQRAEAIKFEIARQVAENGTRISAANGAALMKEIEAKLAAREASNLRYIQAQAYGPMFSRSDMLGAYTAEQADKINATQRKESFDQGVKLAELGVKEKENASKIEEKSVLLPNGQRVYAPRKETAQKVSEEIGNFKLFETTLRNLIEKVSKQSVAGRMLPSAERDKLLTNYKLMIQAMSKFPYNAGALDAGSVELFESELGDPNGLRSILPRLQQIQETITSGFYESIGSQLGTTIPTATPNAKRGGWDEPPAKEAR